MRAAAFYLVSIRKSQLIVMHKSQNCTLLRTLFSYLPWPAWWLDHLGCHPRHIYDLIYWSTFCKLGWVDLTQYFYYCLSLMWILDLDIWVCSFKWVLSQESSCTAVKRQLWSSLGLKDVQQNWEGLETGSTWPQWLWLFWEEKKILTNLLQHIPTLHY